VKCNRADRPTVREAGSPLTSNSRRDLRVGGQRRRHAPVATRAEESARRRYRVGDADGAGRPDTLGVGDAVGDVARAVGGVARAVADAGGVDGPDGPDGLGVAGRDEGLALRWVRDGLGDGDGVGVDVGLAAGEDDPVDPDDPVDTVGGRTSR
jgi:hypothetical protein